MPLNTIEAIHARYSCRDFSDRMPADDDLQTIAEAALASPSAMNRQPWQIIIVKDKELIADLETEGMKALAALADKSAYARLLSRGGTLFYKAPCMIVIALNSIDSSGYEPVDCGIVTQSMALAATSLGINSLICGLAKFAFDGEKSEDFKQRLSFPEGYEIGIAVLLGYAAETGGTPHELDSGKITVIE